MKLLRKSTSYSMDFPCVYLQLIQLSSGYDNIHRIPISSIRLKLPVWSATVRITLRDLIFGTINTELIEHEDPRGRRPMKWFTLVTRTPFSHLGTPVMRLSGLPFMQHLIGSIMTTHSRSDAKLLHTNILRYAKTPAIFNHKLDFYRQRKWLISSAFSKPPNPHRHPCRMNRHSF